MRLSTIATVLVSLCWGSNAAIPQAQFDALKCAAGVGWAYSMNNCQASSIVDKCGKTWQNLFKFPIADGNGGEIIVRIFRRADTKEIYLFFPGTNGFSNFQTDFNFAKKSYNFNGLCNNCQIHGGFLDAFLGGKQTIISSTQYIKNIYPDHSLVIAGGSLGGALASLAFAEFMSNWSYNLIPSRGISFGQPRVGNGAWAAFMNGLTNAGSSSPKWQRVTHGYDSIPRAPPPQWDWMHFGGETWAKDRINVFPPRPDASSTDYCAQGGFGAEPANCNNSGAFAGNIGDHTTYPGYQGEAATC